MPVEARSESVRLPGGKTVSYRLLLIIILSFAVLASFALIYLHRSDAVTGLQGDEIDYNRLAVQLVHDHSYDSTYRAPAYPFLLAGIYSVVGTRLPVVYVIQAILLLASLLIVHQIAFYITRNHGISILTVALCALWPPFYAAETSLLTETLSGFLLAALILTVMKLSAKPRFSSAVSAGILTGIGTLAKSTVIPLIVVFPALVALTGGNWTRKIKYAVVMVLLSFVVLAPWTIRNYRVTGKIIPVTTGGGMNFWLGNWPEYHEKGWEWMKFPPPLDKALAGKSEVQRDKILMKEGMRYIKEDPIRAAGLCLQKFSNLWLGGIGKSSRVMGQQSAASIGNFAIPKVAVVQFPVFLAALVGWFLLPRESRKRSYPIAAVIICWTLIYVATTSVGRYAVPVEFYKLFFVSITVSKAWQLITSRRLASTQL